MNKTAIKNFAVWARRKLISDITYKAGMLGITDSGIAEPLPISTKDLQFFDIGTKDYAEVSGNEIAQRKALVDAIKRKEKSSKTYKEAFEYIVEEVAYTWFNRLIAIRFMEVNDYLPSGIRVLSSENSAKNEPDFVTTPFDTDLEFTPFEQDRVIQLKDENKLDELFRMLFIKECNKLYEILPELFEKTDDYTELLLTISFTDKDGVVYHLVHDIEEKDFDIETVDENGKVNGQVEILGWMYQYYISEKHEEVIDPLHGKTIKKEDIPAATQLFTTDWVVRYMVDNSLGRYWIERNPESKLADKLEFFVTPKNGEINYINEKVDPTELTFFDPCMGSGHILVYAFDVLMEIYRECGYSDRDAALNIVQFNLHGLDIDKRAYQLAYFAVMMKARSYNRRALTSGVWNNIAAIEESNDLDAFKCDGVTNDKEQNKIGEYLLDAYRHAKEIGSLQTIEAYDYKAFTEYLLNLKSPETQIDLFTSIWVETMVPAMLKLTKQANVMSKKYAVVCTNPPYMNKLESHLKDFVTTSYKAYSGDLFSVFMYHNFSFCKSNGYSAFMTPNVWMFIKTYESLRKYILDCKSIVSLIQMAKGAFFKEATVDICAFILSNSSVDAKGTYFRLEEFKGDMDVQKAKVLEAISDKNCNYFYETNKESFSKIPGTPIAYWASEKMLQAFSNGQNFGGDTKKGVLTGKNDVFLRFWHEVSFNKTGFGLSSHEDMLNSKKKWFPVTSGGLKRKWYGNFDTIVNLENDGFEIKNTVTNYRLRDPQYYMREAVTWTEVSSGIFSCRYVPEGILFGNGGPVSFFYNNNLFYHLGLLNSNTVMSIMSYLAPTVNYGPEQIEKIPLIVENKEIVDDIVKNNIDMSKADWDSFETSWDFRKHPLIKRHGGKIYRSWNNNDVIYNEADADKIPWNYSLEQSYQSWEIECENRFNQLKANEEELNRIFIDIYGLQEELTPKVEDKDVTVRKADLQREIKSLISYAVGCMLGRYSLDIEGLAYAGGEWDNTKYSTFIPDADNCLPITDEEYFEDDIVGKFVKFIEVVYGELTLEENLDFIAKALGNKGNTSREVIRNYFLNDFIKDHIKIYQKRPVYWLYDSGKQNGFKALVYMHRYNADTTGNMRVEYLHRMQRVYEKELERMQDTIDNSRDNKEISAATKRKEKLQKQLKETKEYDAKVAHLALSRIGIDLDDGVKVNYEKVQTASDGTKLDILAKI